MKLAATAYVRYFSKSTSRRIHNPGEPNLTTAMEHYREVKAPTALTYCQINLYGGCGSGLSAYFLRARREATPASMRGRDRKRFGHVHQPLPCRKVEAYEATVDPLTIHARCGARTASELITPPLLVEPQLSGRRGRCVRELSEGCRVDNQS